MEIEGGKIKSLKQIGRDMNKGFKKTVAVPLKKKVGRPANNAVFKPGLRKLGEMGTQVGAFTNKELLPGAVTVGIPLAGAMVGTLGAMAGIPPQLTVPLTENLLKEYIPDQYQSKNKYVNMFASLPTMALTGDYDEEQLDKMGRNFTSSVIGDVSKAIKPKRNYDNPYQDVIQQMMNNYPEQQQQYYNQLYDEQQQYEQQPQPDTEIEQQLEHDENTANVSGLLGAGLKKKNKSKKKPKHKEVEEEVEVYTKTKPSYKKYSYAKNSSLEQLLDAKADKEEKAHKKALKEMVEKINLNF